jgi:hypothetical protein
MTRRGFRGGRFHNTAHKRVTGDLLRYRMLLQIAGLYVSLARHVDNRHDRGTAHRNAEHDTDHHRDDA